MTVIVGRVGSHRPRSQAAVGVSNRRVCETAFSSVYWMISVAWARTDGGIVKPLASAALRLMSQIGHLIYGAVTGLAYPPILRRFA